MSRSVLKMEALVSIVISLDLIYMIFYDTLTSNLELNIININNTF